MTKPMRRKSVAKEKYIKFLETAEHFYDAAKDSMDLEYWTAAGVIIVQSAIAYSDALCIKLGGVRSSGDNHEDAVTLLENIIADSSEKSRALNQLKRIIEEKTRVSYLGELYTRKQTLEMWKRLERFARWAREILER